METAATKSLEPAVQVSWGNRLLHLASRFTVLIALLLLIATFSILSPDFLQFDNWSNIILQSATLGIAATGATLVIIIAGIDLSVGSVIALAGILAAGLMVHQHLPGWLGWVVCWRLAPWSDFLTVYLSPGSAFLPLLRHCQRWQWAEV